MRETALNQPKQMDWSGCEVWDSSEGRVGVVRSDASCGAKKSPWSRKTWRKSPEVLAISVGWGSSRRH
jgi:hypothetical protein